MCKDEQQRPTTMTTMTMPPTRASGGGSSSSNTGRLKSNFLLLTIVILVVSVADLKYRMFALENTVYENAAAGGIRTTSTTTIKKQREEKSSTTGGGSSSSVSVVDASGGQQQRQQQREQQQEKEEEGQRQEKVLVAQQDDVVVKPYNPDDDLFGYGPPVRITEGMHVSSPPPPKEIPAKARPVNCSCWTDTKDQKFQAIATGGGKRKFNNELCCKRLVYVNHKFGSHLMRIKLLGIKPENNAPYFHLNINTTNAFYGLTDDMYKKRYYDHRRVFVWRNWFDAIVSGYLYHKAGNECWLDGDGNPRPPGWEIQKGRIMEMKEFPNGAPLGRDRNLCRYLEGESETDGMRVYVEWVIRHFYSKTVELFKEVQTLEDPLHRRTMFVCFEELTAPDAMTKFGAIRRIADWMYPAGRHHYEEDGKKPLPMPPGEEYSGGHATSHEPVLRKRLLDIVRHLDETEFRGAIAMGNSLFSCDKQTFAASSRS